MLGLFSHLSLIWFINITTDSETSDERDSHQNDQFFQVPNFIRIRSYKMHTYQALPSVLAYYSM